MSPRIPLEWVEGPDEVTAWMWPDDPDPVTVRFDPEEWAELEEAAGDEDLEEYVGRKIASELD